MGTGSLLFDYKRKDGLDWNGMTNEVAPRTEAAKKSAESSCGVSHD
jgi:hypothetical protein